jgi:hypothetical protein
MNDELRMMWKDIAVAYFKVLLEGLKKSMKYLSHDSQPSIRASNPGAPEC